MRMIAVLERDPGGGPLDPIPPSNPDPAPLDPIPPEAPDHDLPQQDPDPQPTEPAEEPVPVGDGLPQMSGNTRTHRPRGVNVMPTCIADPHRRGGVWPSYRGVFHDNSACGYRNEIKPEHVRPAQEDALAVTVVRVSSEKASRPMGTCTVVWRPGGARECEGPILSDPWTISRSRRDVKVPGFWKDRG